MPDISQWPPLLAIIGFLTYIIYLLIRAGKGQRQIANNHLHVLPEIAADIKRIAGDMTEAKQLLQSINNDVIYLKAELKYVTARTGMREYLIEESLTRLEQEYAQRFVRVHRNCLVAKSAIRGFERVAGEGGEGRWVVVLDGCHEKIALSRRQQHIVRELGR